MKNIGTYIVAAAMALVINSPASAECYADYKAKRDTPLRLHYGVIEIDDALCNAPDRLRSDIANRISRDDWQLLNVLSVFGDEGLSKRQDSAGENFLRY